jgi:hypothetical protein
MPIKKMGMLRKPGMASFSAFEKRSLLSLIRSEDSGIYLARNLIHKESELS